MGRVLSALPVLAMLFSATFKFRAPAEVVQIFTGKFGYPPQTLTPLGVVELSCAVLYAIPQTAVLGALLMTGYLGGAVATHVRVSDVWLPPAVLGVVAWVGLYLREPRLRDLLPLRRLPRQSGNP
ncbi:MAG TPA: DoxX family protein [Gemmatimonadales bacterium]|nr:DoxX family protein [Gemmatimonadales bacterium]